MKCIALLTTIVYSLAATSTLTQVCDTACAQCWTVTGRFTTSICAQCSEGYFFNLAQPDTKCYNVFDYDNGRQISGYHRPCAECGPHNYVNNYFDCSPCSLGCETCLPFSGKCSKCYSGNSDQVYDPLTEDGECSCTHGGAQLMDGYCYCNNDDKYIDESGQCLQCNKCTRDKAKCLNSPFAQIPEGQWDDDNKDCPQDCHPSCAACTGPSRSDCVKSNTTNLLCNRNNLWESVIENDIERCYCVCHSQEMLISTLDCCLCDEDREAKDLCTIINCTEEEKLSYRYQCVCKYNKTDGEPLANGKIPCV